MTDPIGFDDERAEWQTRAMRFAGDLQHFAAESAELRDCLGSTSYDFNSGILIMGIKGGVAPVPMAGLAAKHGMVDVRYQPCRYSIAQVHAARDTLLAIGIRPGCVSSDLGGARVIGISADDSGLNIAVEVHGPRPDDDSLARAAPHISEADLGIDPAHVGMSLSRYRPVPLIGPAGSSPGTPATAQ